MLTGKRKRDASARCAPLTSASVTLDARERTHSATHSHQLPEFSLKRERRRAASSVRPIGDETRLDWERTRNTRRRGSRLCCSFAAAERPHVELCVSMAFCGLVRAGIILLGLLVSSCERPRTQLFALFAARRAHTRPSSWNARPFVAVS